MTSELKEIEAQFRVDKWDFESSDLNEDVSDAYVMAAFGRMEPAGQAAQVPQQQLAALQASIGAHQQAVQAIAAGLLQIAKQEMWVDSSLWATAKQ
ncbi:hypothetical protein [Noviherbaspirillum sp. Root189]|uniref:hypothetical protein n=1 Tax=Noviherbaspirillum sp. Root189 TaxID=1736487 RepID=UPI0012E3994D|nr:hypothetical protein [Noviherbaspirillum sp. Root189]